MDKLHLNDSFGNVETTQEHRGYTYSVGRALTIVILGSLCGAQSVSQIHQWAKTPRVSEFLREEFHIHWIPCYYWLLCLLQIIKPESLNQKFTEWAVTLLPEVLKDLTITFDGKTICSTGKMDEYDRPLHILSAHLAELGLTIGHKAVGKKSNEIPAMQSLLGLINIEGCMVVADALHCQTKTANAIIDNGGDYLLNVKGNQETLESDIEEFVQSPELRREMDTASTREKNGGRIEFRKAFVSHDVDWLVDLHPEWRNLAMFGAINRQFTDKEGNTTNEVHMYISSRPLSPEGLLKYARNEWAVESMHWLLDVHYREDDSRVRCPIINENLNIIRKIALNIIRNYKNQTSSKDPISKLLYGCLLDCDNIQKVLNV